MKKGVKKNILIIAIVLAILICAYMVIWAISRAQWNKGLFLFENDIQIYTDNTNAEFNINAIVVGDDVVDIVKSGNIKCYLEDGTNTTRAKISVFSISQTNYYYEVVFTVSCNLPEGSYLFDNVIISDANEENRWNAPGRIEITTESKEDKIPIESSILAMRSSNICEFVYTISNPTKYDIIISAIDGDVQYSDLLLINAEDTDSEVIDFTNAKKFSFPITLPANQKIYFYYNIPISAVLSNTYLYLSPRIDYKISRQDEVNKLYFQLNSDPPIIQKEANDVLKYINEREVGK